MVKTFFSITAFLFILIFVSCSSHKYRKALIEADSIASVNPHIAMAILDSIKEEMQTASEEEQMYYKLLCIKAPDKAYIRLTSDTTILPLVKYYETKGDKHLLPEAYFYAGCIYMYMNDAPRASEYYYKALNLESGKNSLLRDIYIFIWGVWHLNKFFMNRLWRCIRKHWSNIRL